jgi:alpha-N-arabinofuranosidase
VAALTLDIFNNNAEKLYMANIAQIANVLQALLLIQDGKCIKTPTYHVFDLYQPHKGATAVKFVSHATAISSGEASEEHCKSCYLTETSFSLKAVEGSASVNNGTVCVTLVNTDPNGSSEVSLELIGCSSGTVETRSLIGSSIHALNTFDEPDAVHLSDTGSISMENGRLSCIIPPGSIVRLLAPIAK